MSGVSSQSIRIAALSLVAGLLLSPALAAAPGGVSDGLRVWLRADAGITAADGGNVLLWADQSGNDNDAVFNPANVYGELSPVFDAANAGANGQPTVRFNDQNALELDLAWLAGTDYTIFVVNARDRTGVANFYIAGAEFGQDRSLVIGYETTSLLRWSHINRDLDTPVENYTGTPIWTLDVFHFSQAAGKTLYRNGQLTHSNDQTQPLQANAGSTLGHWRAFGTTYWFQGDLAEVIVYDRALAPAERVAVEQQLAERYAVPVPRRKVSSTWVAAAPVVDGLPGEPSWLGTGSVPLFDDLTQAGTLRFLNDAGFLYVLVDVTLDTIDNAGNEDRMGYSIDVNENGVADPYVDLEYGIRSTDGGICRQLYIDSSSSTVCMASTSFFGKNFTPSPWEPAPHRVWEWAFDFSEISAAPGELVRMAVQVLSQDPAIYVELPPGTDTRVEDYLEIDLAEDPDELIFFDGFELP